MSAATSFVVVLVVVMVVSVVSAAAVDVEVVVVVAVAVFGAVVFENVGVVGVAGVCVVLGRPVFACRASSW